MFYHCQVFMRMVLQTLQNVHRSYRSGKSCDRTKKCLAAWIHWQCRCRSHLPQNQSTSLEKNESICIIAHFCPFTWHILTLCLFAEGRPHGELSSSAESKHRSSAPGRYCHCLGFPSFPLRAWPNLTNTKQSLPFRLATVRLKETCLKSLRSPNTLSL